MVHLRQQHIFWTLPSPEGVRCGIERVKDTFGGDAVCSALRSNSMLTSPPMGAFLPPQKTAVAQRCERVYGLRTKALIITLLTTLMSSGLQLSPDFPTLPHALTHTIQSQPLIKNKNTDGLYCLQGGVS